jgi:hypothetical protein
MISSLLNEADKLGWQIILHKNCSNRTGHNASSTPNALVRVNEELIVPLVNAIAWTDFYAGRIFGSDTRLGNHRRVAHGLEYGRADQKCP